MLAVHQDHPIAASDHVSVESLEHETFIVDASRLRLKPLQKLCQEHGFLPNVGFEVESTALIYKLVENNQGIAIVPIGLGCDLMRLHPDHHLRLVHIDGDLPHIIIGIASHKTYTYSEAATQFEEYIIERLAEEDRLIREMGFEFE